MATLGAWTVCPGTRCTLDLLGSNVYELSLEYPHPNLSTVPLSKYKVETLYPGTVVSTLSVSSEEVSRNYSWQQNELRHFTQNLAFLHFPDFKRRKPSSPPCSFVPMFELPIENNNHPNFEWRGQGRGADSFVLQSYPIWVQCLNNFVADCRTWAPS